MHPKDLERVIKSLEAQEDYSVIEKVLDIPVTKKNMEFLCKAGEVLYWDFIEEETEKIDKEQTSSSKHSVIEKIEPTEVSTDLSEIDNIIIPETSIVKEVDDSFNINEPSRFQETFESNTIKLGEINLSPVEAPKRAVDVWDSNRTNLISLLGKLYPDGFTSEKLLGLLLAILQIKLEDSIVELTPTLLTGKIVPTLGRVIIDEKNNEHLAVLNYLDIIINSRPIDEMFEYIIDSLHKSWFKTVESPSIARFFETIFSAKLSGI